MNVEHFFFKVSIVEEYTILVLFLQILCKFEIMSKQKVKTHEILKFIPWLYCHVLPKIENKKEKDARWKEELELRLEEETVLVINLIGAARSSEGCWEVQTPRPHDD